MTQKVPLKAWFLLILLSLIWGSSFILIKKGLTGLEPAEVGAVRILSAAVVLLPFALWHFRKVQRKHLPYIVSVGLVGSFFPAFLFAIAQTRLESAITGVLNALTPIFTMLIGWVIYQQKQSPRVLLGVMVGFAGTVVLITAGSGGSITQFNFYALFVVLATVFYALNVNLIKYHLYGLSSMTISSLSLAFVGPLAFVQLMFTDLPVKLAEVEGTVPAFLFIVLLGVLGTAIALLLFNRLVSLTDPVFTSSVTYIIPIISIGWGLLDGEQLLWSHVAGMVAILLGVYIANSLKRK